MKIAFWFWLIMAVWLIWGGVLGYRGRPAAAPFGPFYWGAGWSLVLFILIAILGCQVFPDPFSTLVPR